MAERPQHEKDAPTSDNDLGKMRKPTMVVGLKTYMARHKINAPTLVMMFKFSLPPTIAIAIYERKEVAAHFSTLGFIPAIIAVLGMAILPRSKFIQTMFFSVVGVCFGTAIALLQFYCSTQARKHTMKGPMKIKMGPSPGARIVGYNSSACVVSAIWLFANIYVISALRGARPQLQFPVIIYCIHTIIAGVYAPSFPDMHTSIKFIERLFEAFLLGLGIATVVALFLPPVNARIAWFGQSRALIQTIQAALKSQASCFRSLESEASLVGEKASPASLSKEMMSDDHEEHRQNSGEVAAKQTKKVLNVLAEMAGKLQEELPFAKQEVAWGHLDASDISEFNKNVTKVIIPLLGLANSGGILRRILRRQGGEENSIELTDNDSLNEDTKSRWCETIQFLSEPVQATLQANVEGLQHVLCVLKLAKPLAEQKGATQNHKDVEAGPSLSTPGEKGFSVELMHRLSNNRSTRKAIIDRMRHGQGFSTEDSDFAHGEKMPAGECQSSNLTDGDDVRRLGQTEMIQTLLYVSLYFILA